MRHAALLTVAFGACFPDDWDGRPYEPTTDPTDPTDESGAPPSVGIVGTWVSEGADRSPLFASAPFEYASVEAVFEAGGSYVVTPVDGEGVEYALTGAWQAQDGAPGTISLSQTDPYVATAEGIWQVDGDQLTYEVVQTVPDYGYGPPTPGAGFGSTTGPGLGAGDNVQLYRRR